MIFRGFSVPYSEVHLNISCQLYESYNCQEGQLYNTGLSLKEILLEKRKKKNFKEIIIVNIYPMKE